LFVCKFYSRDSQGITLTFTDLSTESTPSNVCEVRYAGILGENVM